MTFRTEEKYPVASGHLTSWVSWLGRTGATILYPSRRVISFYLDNESYGMYSDSMEGVLPRKKLRFRTYDSKLDGPTSSLFETKISSIEGRFKTSCPTIFPPSLARCVVVDNQYGECRPRVMVSYSRNYYLVDGIRITVDDDIRYSRITDMSPLPSVIDPYGVIEIKGPAHLPADLLVTTFPWGRSRFSKYCRAVAAISLGRPNYCI